MTVGQQGRSSFSVCICLGVPGIFAHTENKLYVYVDQSYGQDD